ISRRERRAAEESIRSLFRLCVTNRQSLVFSRAFLSGDRTNRVCTIESPLQGLLFYVVPLPRAALCGESAAALCRWAGMTVPFGASEAPAGHQQADPLNGVGS